MRHLVRRIMPPEASRIRSIRILALAAAVVLCLLLPGLARPAGAQHATAEKFERAQQSPGRGKLYAVTPIQFGGYNEQTGMAYDSRNYSPSQAIWTWDAGSADPLEGWTSIDLTENERTFFGVVNADSFVVHGCLESPPMFPGSTTQLWCGAFEDYADSHDWLVGTGYGNRWCQWARSPRVPFFPGHDIDIRFLYIQESEPGFDHTTVNLLAYRYGELLESQEIGRLSGRIGTPTLPDTFEVTVPDEVFSATPDEIQLELRFTTDANNSDEDGGYSTIRAPFSVDDTEMSNLPVFSWDFESGSSEGWTFSACPGVGRFMGLCSEAEWTQWTDGPPYVWPPCGLYGNALYCATDVSFGGFPGHPPGHHEALVSPPMDRTVTDDGIGEFPFIAAWDAITNLPYRAATFYRVRFSYSPYRSPVTGMVLPWSPFLGQESWYYEGQTARCVDQMTYNLTNPPEGTPLPDEWEQVRLVFEVMSDAGAFGIAPDQANYAGITNGSPIFDNVRAIWYDGYDSLTVALAPGHLFQDGFGQLSPEFLDPADVGNIDIAYDLSRDRTTYWDCHGDTAVVRGPPVLVPEEQYWVELCFKIGRKGPAQDAIPAYQSWKSRLYGNPETDFVCALMDSAEIQTDGRGLVADFGRSRVTYFHEHDPGFDPGNPDCSAEQEILPDQVFTPGTRIDYYYRSYWANQPGLRFHLPATGNFTVEILPGMELAGLDREYDAIFPSVLYVDAFSRGAENVISQALTDLDLEFDLFDRLDFSSNFDCPLRRSLGGGITDFGAQRANGCSLHQLLGYRLILWNTGNFGSGSGEAGDFSLLEEWLNFSECGVPDVRRALLMNGDQIARIMEDKRPSLSTSLGVQWTGGADAVRDLEGDDYDCVGIAPSAVAEFTPSGPLAVFGNGYPTWFDYRTLAAENGGVVNLEFASSPNSPNPWPYPASAQVLKEQMAGPGGVGGWKSAVDGFSWHHLSEAGIGGEECSEDTLAIIAGCADMLGPELAWLSDGGAAPFVPWWFECEAGTVGERFEGHPSGLVDFLYACRPNPFSGNATLRFSLSRSGPVAFDIFDVGGRLIRRLDAKFESAGEHTIVWDGADTNGARTGSGIYWVQMRVPGGEYTSTRRILRMDD